MSPQDPKTPVTRIPGRPVIDVGSGATIRVRELVDDDGDDDDLDDADMLEQIRERLKPESGRPWAEIAATLESITVAMEIPSSGDTGCLDAYGKTVVLGCLLRVISWDSEGLEECETKWLAGVRLQDLLPAPDPKTSTPPTESKA